MPIRLLKREPPSGWGRLRLRTGIRLAAIFASFVFGALFLAVTGHDVLPVYRAMWAGTFGSPFGQVETIVAATPLVFTGLAVAIAFRMRLWNIGAEGQFYFGAIGASAMAYSFQDMPAALLLPAMAVGGMVLGAFWASIPATLRAFLNTNEIVPTLLLNYVAILWAGWLVNDPWRDPASRGFPLGEPFSASAILPQEIFGTAVHGGALVAPVAAVVVYALLTRTTWGYKIKVIGENPRAARYAGFPIARNIVFVMLLSGALAGLGGMTQVSGEVLRMQDDISVNFGYTGIIIATLASFSPLVVVIVAVLFGALTVAGFELQTVGLPQDIVLMLQGMILFFALAGELLINYRIEWRTRPPAGKERGELADREFSPTASPTGGRT